MSKVAGHKIARWCGIGIAILGMTGCFYPPGVQTVNLDRTSWVNPDDFRVKSDAYPTYRVTRRIDNPPSAAGRYVMESMELGDVWRVTHRVQDRYLIYSEEFQKRQCEWLFKTERYWERGQRGLFDHRCIASFLFEISISEDGSVAGGWQFLKNPERVLFASDRLIRQFNDEDKFADWGPQPLFAPIARPSDQVRPMPDRGAADEKR